MDDPYETTPQTPPEWLVHFAHFWGVWLHTPVEPGLPPFDFAEYNFWLVVVNLIWIISAIGWIVPNQYDFLGWVRSFGFGTWLIGNPVVWVLFIMNGTEHPENADASWHGETHTLEWAFTAFAIYFLIVAILWLISKLTDRWIEI